MPLAHLPPHLFWVSTILVSLTLDANLAMTDGALYDLLTKPSSLDGTIVDGMLAAGELE